jgi:hypothetical protein
MKIYCDIDNTICKTEGNDYRNSEPLLDKIAIINNYYEEGYEITYWTSRGNDSGKDWLSFTYHQLREWGCKFHNLKMGKDSFDILFDDKAKVL